MERRLVNHTPSLDSLREDLVSFVKFYNHALRPTTAHTLLPDREVVILEVDQLRRTRFRKFFPMGHSMSPGYIVKSDVLGTEIDPLKSTL